MALGDVWCVNTSEWICWYYRLEQFPKYQVNDYSRSLYMISMYRNVSDVGAYHGNVLTLYELNLSEGT